MTTIKNKNSKIVSKKKIIKNKISVINKEINTTNFKSPLFKKRVECLENYLELTKIYKKYRTTFELMNLKKYVLNKIRQEPHKTNLYKKFLKKNMQLN